LACGKQNSEAGGMAYIVEHLPSKHKALSSNSSTAKEKKKESRALAHESQTIIHF
jgi:hypothetical protein